VNISNENFPQRPTENPVNTSNENFPQRSTENATSILNNKNKPQHHAFQQMIPRSIASIVKGYKIGVTKWYRINALENGRGIRISIWQRNYYERIIRDEKAYFNISKYIRNNPANWKADKFFK
jgi:REP element-mobilizing transposase RayT